MQTDRPAPLVELRSLRHTWPGQPSPTLDIPQLHIAPGERVFLHGPSGCGKSTLLSLITGMRPAQSGRVTVLGQDLGTLSPAQRDRFRADHIGYVFQQFNLLPYLSVLDNVTLSARFSALRRQRARTSPQHTSALLTRLGLSELQRRPVHSLSVGQQQRVALARALMGHPELIVADEPTSALDDDHRDAFMALLMQCAEAQGASVLLVSHDHALARHFHRRISLARPHA